jgi:hypothetical protein
MQSLYASLTLFKEKKRKRGMQEERKQRKGTERRADKAKDKNK